VPVVEKYCGTGCENGKTAPEGVVDSGIFGIKKPGIPPDIGRHREKTTPWVKVLNWIVE
jgi:hypothetical protein